MSKRARYQHFRNIEDVRAERRRIGWELKSAEQQLKTDYEGVVKMFSVGYLIARISEKTTEIYSLTQWAVVGYDLINGFIRKFREKAAHARAGIEAKAE